MGQRIKQHFAVRAAFKGVALLLQFGAQFKVIVNFAVIHQGVAAVRGVEGLMPRGRKINDGQTGLPQKQRNAALRAGGRARRLRAQQNAVVGKGRPTPVVWAAMGQGRAQFAGQTGNLDKAVVLPLPPGRNPSENAAHQFFSSSRDISSSARRCISAPAL